MRAANSASRAYYATDHGKEVKGSSVRAYQASDHGKKVIRAYRASDHGKAVQRACEARARARMEAAIKAAVEAHQRWLASLTPEERLRVLEEEEAMKAVEKAMKADNKREWAYAKGMANGICRDLAAALLATDAPAWLRYIFAREKVGQEIFCADGGWANSAIKVMELGGLIFHASDKGPHALDLVDDKPYMLRPAAKWNSRRPVPYVYGTASNDIALALQFVEAHEVRGVRKHFVSLARGAPASHSLYVYVLDPRHDQYDDFNQLFVDGGVIKHCMRFFARCRRPVNVAPGTPGVTVLRIFWKEGDARTPHVEVVSGYGEAQIPTMPLPECIAELRAMYAREQARLE